MTASVGERSQESSHAIAVAPLSRFQDKSGTIEEEEVKGVDMKDTNAAPELQIVDNIKRDESSSSREPSPLPPPSTPGLNVQQISNKYYVIPVQPSAAQKARPYAPWSQASGLSNASAVSQGQDQGQQGIVLVMIQLRQRKENTFIMMTVRRTGRKVRRVTMYHCRMLILTLGETNTSDAKGCTDAGGTGSDNSSGDNTVVNNNNNINMILAITTTH
ncbi:hypothetical protein BC939DRAFT_532795 [Gamsiella multidivaricata]|uniref:uncharacterized protein n=1 Tax=Gamsiella multidivaricata TaxID=101098 RepID=UPI00221E40F0|nr:uncharacterized protein BC939DRAFT_532795 [Gamsiella multidivaricata]KAI7817396.1 hypothetical protein BC939DRAFT_532795 [Gamsiella multidivaricata]